MRKHFILTLALLTVPFIVTAQEPAPAAEILNDAGIQDDYASLVLRLSEFERVFEDDYAVTDADIAGLESLASAAESGAMPDLVTKARMLLVLAGEKAEAQKRGGKATGEPLNQIPELFASYQDSTALKTATFASVGAGLLSLGLFNVFWHLSDREYASYLNAPDPATALDDWNRVKLFDALTIGTAIAAGGFLGGAMPLLFLNPFNIALKTDDAPEVRVESLVNARLKLENAVTGLSFMEPLSLGIISLSAVALAGFGASAGLEAAWYYEYGISNYAEDAFSLRRDLETLRTISLSCAVTAGAGLIASGMFALLIPKEPAYSLRAGELNAELRALKDVGYAPAETAELSLMLTGLYGEKEALEKRIQTSQTSGPIWKTAIFSSLGGAALSLSLSGYFISREIIAYRQYNDAYYVSDSTALWQTVEDARRKALGLGITGGTLLATSAVLSILMPKPKALSRELSYIDARIKSIEELLAQ